MATGWFYAAFGEEKRGPFSPTQMQDLAAAGSILPIDTVWQEGNDKGALASRVEHLFARTVAPVPMPPAPIVVESTPLLVPETPVAPPAPSEPKPIAKKGRATAVKGAEIAGQDGEYARYRMKCDRCGHKDAACHRIAITNRSFKGNYYCPKCKRRSEVSIHCQL